jgi:hypothetical protein
VCAALPAAPAFADEPILTITPRSDLRFGRFAVFGSGSRTITPQGAVFDSAIFSEPGSVTGPAEFDLSFDRGNESKFPIDVYIELVLSGPNSQQLNGVTAQVSAFTSDLAGAPVIVPGRAISVVMLRCPTRVCTRSFRVGGRLDVTKYYGGATLAIPLPIDATIIVVK